jgi:hypothetical protein
MLSELRDVTGSRGEKILELWLTDYKEFRGPLFRPGFLSEKWPTIDFYVELRAVRKRKPYFFAQAKATTTALSGGLRISTKRKDIELLLRIPGPTYIFGIHEPSKRVFVQSVHTGTPLRAITRIPLSQELTRKKFRVLHKEVREFWKTNGRKPISSAFA